MILFVSGATTTVRKHRQCGELIVPAARNDPDTLKLVPGLWGMDNGAYNGGFDAELFMEMLRAFRGRKGCRFVSSPDVVADAAETLRRWPFWSAVIRGVGFVPALVAQDGMLVGEIPWPEVGAIFIGGTTEWKLGPQAADVMAYAKARGLWVHVGRVNSGERMWDIARKGADSFDGTRNTWWANEYIGESIEIADATMAQGRLV